VREAPYRVLALDAGGVRGIVEVVWLERLARHLGGPLYSHFDLIVGTGVGALIGYALALGKEPAVLLATWERCAATAFGPDDEEADGRREMLQEVFRDARLCDFRTRAAGLAFDPERLQLELVSPDTLDSTTPVWQAAELCAEHPMYVDPFAGVSEFRPFPPSVDPRFLVASFGSGQVAGIRASSVFGERSVILRHLVSKSSAPIPSDALFPAGSYFRFQTSVPADLGAVDGVENVDMLRAVASAHLGDGTDDRLQELSHRLTGEAAE